MIDPWDFSHDHTTPRASVAAIIILVVIVIADAIYHQIDRRTMDTPRARLIIRDVAMLAFIGLVLYLAIVATP